MDEKSGACEVPLFCISFWLFGFVTPALSRDLLYLLHTCDDRRLDCNLHCDSSPPLAFDDSLIRVAYGSQDYFTPMRDRSLTAPLSADDAMAAYACRALDTCCDRSR